MEGMAGAGGWQLSFADSLESVVVGRPEQAAMGKA